MAKAKIKAKGKIKAQAKDLQGFKGDSPRTPVESANTLKSVALATILDLVSEGPIVGLTDGLKSIYLDETPVENSDGTRNFTNFQVEYRLGTQDQSYIPGFDSVDNEISTNVELKFGTPFVRAFSNTNMDAIRVRLSVPALHKTNKSNGDISGYNVSYAIAVSTDSGPYVTMLTSSFSGKTMSKYERDHKISLPKATTGWNIRVTRTTPFQDGSEYANSTYIESVTEIIDAKLRYPNSAIIGTTLEATQFQSIPSRAFDVKGRIIRVPSNYDAESRTYNGVWDGTFKLSWTDNPAWIYYDLATHPRYGIGHLIGDAQVNKWILYNIGRYCDELVPDGRGGQEPRFSCNIYLQKQADAYKVLQDLATVFRGIAYWGNGEIRAVSDRPEEPVFTYSAANVIDGEFSYEGSARKTRYNVALVSWNDMSNMGRAAIEYVDDPVGIARYGIQQTDATAVGCTSQGQAQRIGRYMIATSQLETQTVAFKVGLDSTLVAPGKIVIINDPLRAGVRLGGRVVSATQSKITIDGETGLVEIGDTLRCVMADGTMEKRTVSAITGAEITVSVGFTDAPAPESMWSAERLNLQGQRYRIISVTEDGNNVFAVSAVRHVEGKFDNADFGTIIDLPIESQLTPPVQLAPTDLTISHYEAAAYVTTSLVLVASWAAAPNATWYEVDYRRDAGDWVKLPRTQGTTIDIRDCWEGVYTVRVRAINSNEVMSMPRVSLPYSLVELTTLPGFTTDIVEEVIEGLNGLPNFVSREEMLEIQQHMLTLGNISWDEAGISASAKYNVERFRLQLDAIDARYVRTESSIVDATQAMFQVTEQMGARFNDVEAQLATERTVRATADGGLASSIEALQVQVGTDITAQIATERQARIDADGALATDITQLRTQVNNDIVAQIDVERTARTTADEALASSITALNSSFGTMSSRISTEETTRANADGALATTISLIGAKSGDGTAFILDTTTAKISAGESLGQRLTAINTAMGDNTALINSEATTRATADNALTSLIALIGAKNGAGTAFIMDMNKTFVDATTSWAVRLANITSSLNQNAADITTEQTARANGDSALTSSISTLSTTVNGHTSSISTQQNSINGLSAQYTVKVDNNGYISGFGLASTPVNGTPYSTFSILADKFRIVSPAGGQRTEYSDGNWRCYDGNGVMRVRMGVW